ncbi:putative FAD-linked sulfhydryl oxidase [Diachasmimorpha longicaudata entomopoxvirus]|uniref:Sulfhydryl oxidase n=1 Tax=Diachasmimorpha longicaudata entomopoxvirus TaxID=109981 RepID=A0A7R5WP03_9POXV|nr:putative FAD-linked sulfhydryl oxidase [Diachasmimorpha longicaudata entomopoxvirus]AKS26456.1 putative FAD-linked sulfhydryl oxidase [Diachasmimorpha longicaudata entomopoxvirus]
MNPVIWGRGTWVFLFIFIYRFRNGKDIEDFKYLLNIFLGSLPCEECKTNCMESMNKNKIYDTDDFLVIFHFFLELYNKFHKQNPIDRTRFENYAELETNKKYLFDQMLK